MTRRLSQKRQVTKEFDMYTHTHNLDRVVTKIVMVLQQIMIEFSFFVEL